ncbi:MAG: hypothetical protein H6674_00055 [Dehalococcoidia bacterium]|nr:hypothetical protein [Dehalococcoidia bacterium]
MERIELLARAEGMAVAAGYVQTTTAAEYRIYPVAGTREKWIGRAQFVRFADGREVALVVTEHRTRPVRWLVARER